MIWIYNTIRTISERLELKWKVKIEHSNNKTINIIKGFQEKKMTTVAHI